MNREIKFRAWDKVGKKMYEDIIWAGGHTEGKGDKENFSIPEPFCEFMQFTGLKDKNGKEIYEGDIVDFTMEPPYFGDVQPIWREEIKYEVNGFNDHLRMKFTQIEVIGNIYSGLLHN